jgi:hypothetical protein
MNEEFKNYFTVPEYRIIFIFFYGELPVNSVLFALKERFLNLQMTENLEISNIRSTYGFYTVSCLVEYYLTKYNVTGSSIIEGRPNVLI